MQFVQGNAGFLGIRGVFLGCGRITKADDVVDWIFGLMRAVRDTGPTMLLPQYLQKIELIGKLDEVK